jgi:hypothetical protein
MKQFEELNKEASKIFTKYMRKNFDQDDVIEFIEWLEDHEDMKEVNWNRNVESPFDIEDFFIDYKLYVINPSREVEIDDREENDEYDEFERYCLEKEYYNNLL